MLQLNLKHPADYDGRFPYFRKPSEIGFFSLDHERKFCNDSHQLKYISIPRNLEGLNWDLSAGYAEAIRKEFGKKEKIDILLTWMLHHQEEIRTYFSVPPSNIPQIDFVCFRGLLTAICGTIYENKDDWMICATKYKSIIYLCAFETEDNIRRRETATERDNLMSSWGYKFEQYMVSDTPQSKPDLSVPVNEKEEFCIVLKGRLDNHNLLFSAEVDGKDTAHLNRPKDSQSTEDYIELKTSRIITTDRQDRNFCRFKLIKWWLQSFLVGIPKIVCGFRDDDGFVRSLSVFPVLEIPKMAQNQWSPASCFSFCSEFLNYVKACVIKDDPRVVYKFYWKPRSPITCEELKSPGEYRVLPDWFIQAFTT